MKIELTKLNQLGRIQFFRGRQYVALYRRCFCIEIAYG